MTKDSSGLDFNDDGFAGSESESKSPIVQRECFIDDGYVEKGYIAEVPRLHGEVRFQYRPTLAEERALFVQHTRKNANSPDKQERLIAQRLAEKITWWSVTRPARQKEVQDGLAKSLNERIPVAVSAAAILKIRPAVVIRLANIVIWGEEGGDVDPLWTTEEREEFDDTLMFSAMVGPDGESMAMKFGDAKAELLEKN